jgi:hypothetical protein
MIVYETLATSLKNKLNVAAVNCDENPSLCRKAGIKGYPTIRLYTPSQTNPRQDGRMEEYKSARNLGPMKKFAMKAVERLVPLMTTLTTGPFYNPSNSRTLPRSSPPRMPSSSIYRILTHLSTIWYV